MHKDERIRDLSRQHQKALAVALALKVGCCQTLQLQWPADAEGKRQKVLHYAEEELFETFKREEEQIFPLVVESSPADRHMCVTLQMEHELMRKLIEEIRIAQGPDLAELLIDFGSLLELHILEEEQQFHRLAPESSPLPRVASL